MRLLVLVITFTFLWPTYCSAKSLSNVVAYYLSTSCDTIPNRVDLDFYSTCSAQCNADLDGDWKSSQQCCPSEDYKATVWDAFGGAAYLLQESYNSDCDSRLGASAFLASGNCEQVIMYVELWKYAVYVIAQLEADGSASVSYFTDSDCTSPLLVPVRLTDHIDTQDTTISQDILNSNTCDENGYRWTYYSADHPYVPDSESSSKSESGSGSNTRTPSIASSRDFSRSGSADNMVVDGTDTKLSPAVAASTSGSNIGMIAGSAGGAIALVLIAFGFVLYRRRSDKPELPRHSQHRSGYLNHSSPATGQRTASLATAYTESLGKGPQGQSGLWNDDLITAKRLARRDVQIQHLLSCGAFGEVYAGVYNDKRVAVKMLSPETRGIISHVNNFLAEAKMTASMDHPRIVHFIGVAWDSLSDLCVVMEYMEGGDLRILLSGYEASDHPTGIDREKATIALHVCHALTYLHSLSPPVIHRDLKSRNVLLNHAMEAKLIDFGISKERLDQTMTAGVGTSLWMAPEVMLGEKYDDKADMFSFGVVLSELDVHTLPYTQAREKNRDPSGKRLPEAIILQQVAMGRLRVEFSGSNAQSIAELSAACVSVDPSLRPTAAEALYKLQVALAQELP
ncbi:unnamed protein product [Phytophthora lilii]|uniref:Unnamed protein product n=1 Tax=Phytophthora lilii TaxID=2077276 RepID=A0A9W7CSE7_9STRA|nr:unnamed protein product [Phytophthora lilii]